MTLFEYLILFLSVFVGGGFAFYIQRNNKDILQLVLSFSGAYILGIAVLHLMPYVFEEHSHIIGIWVLGGFFIQMLLDQLSAGVEHGHIHLPKNRTASFALQILLGLSIHAFLEGMPLGGSEAFESSSHNHSHNHEYLLWGIILHKAPAAFALVLLFLQAKYSKSLIIWFLLLFALMSPLGALSASILDFDSYTQRIIMAVVIGSFLHIATTIIFEIDASQHHRIPLRRILAIAAGTVAAISTVL